MSSIYYKNQKYTGPTLDLGSGSLTTDDKTIVGAINELDAEVGGLVESGGEENNRYFKIGNMLICYGRVAESVPASATSDQTVTFAKSFSDVPTIVITPIVGDDVNVDFAYLKSRSAYSCVITLKNTWTSANSVVVCWIAIGRRN